MDSTVQTIKRIIAVVTGILAGILGGFDSLLQFYTGLMVVDFALGCVKGIKAKNFSSAIACIVEKNFLNNKRHSKAVFKNLP